MKRIVIGITACLLLGLGTAALILDLFGTRLAGERPDQPLPGVLKLTDEQKFGIGNPQVPPPQK